MRRDEAIELLEDLDGYFYDNQGRDYDEAFRMAIEALSAEPTDPISRQDAISVFVEWMQKEFGYLDLNRGERFIDAIESLPFIRTR